MRMAKNDWLVIQIDDFKLSQRSPRSTKYSTKYICTQSSSSQKSKGCLLTQEFAAFRNFYFATFA